MVVSQSLGCKHFVMSTIQGFYKAVAGDLCAASENSADCRYCLVVDIMSSVMQEKLEYNLQASKFDSCIHVGCFLLARFFLNGTRSILPSSQVLVSASPLNPCVLLQCQFVLSSCAS